MNGSPNPPDPPEEVVPQGVPAEPAPPGQQVPADEPVPSDGEVAAAAPPAGEAAEPAPPAGEAAEPASPAGQVPAVAAPGPRRGPVRWTIATLRRIPHPPWRSRRGLLLLFFLVAGFGSVVTVAGVMTVHYTETASFCGRCHTMGPEMKAYAMSPHSDVACAECHVEPGVQGFVKAKINGTKQLVQVITGTFPEPIPPPDHSALPPVSKTCLKCHSLDRITQNGGPIKLVLRPTFQSDEKNTRELVAVVLRPQGLGDNSGTTTGVHWHVQQKVTYSTSQPQGAQTIDLVEVTRPNGAVEQYVAASKVAGSTNVAQDIAQLRAGQTNRVMDCLDCHNRVGHAVPSISQALDASIAGGRISSSLPYVKREGAALLAKDYPNLDAADTAIASLRTTYKTKYPLVASAQAAQVDGAVGELERLYRQLASPDMKVQAQTYPDNLGHSSSPGCFRCHDGAHVQVVNGKLTGKAIPSTCSTCHTFPQVGGSVAGILIGGAPATHNDRLYVFSHRSVATSSDPTGTACGQCHQRAYCVNCHSTGAVKVKHDQMLYNHATSIRISGGQACAYCHQPVYCSGCHGKSPVLQTLAGQPADRPQNQGVPAP